MIEVYLVGAAVLLMLSVVASKFSDRYGIPSLLLFLFIGMLAGSDGPGNIYFDDPVLAQYIGVIALVVILFSGGLDTEWRSIRVVMKEGLVLATLGVFITAFIVGTAAHFLLGLTLLEGLLLGAITSSTDAAAVFAMLRSRGINLTGRVKPLLELESGSNDPMAVFLTVGLIQLLANPQQPAVSLIPLFFQQLVIGGAIGYFGGRLLLYLINQLRLGYEGLYPVLVFGMLLFAYGTASLLNGSGFLAVYGVGLVLGREDFLHKRSLLRFFDGMAWLMQITMFLTLGLLVFPSRLVPVIIPGLMIAGVLIFVARPVSIWLSLALSGFSPQAKTFLSWAGLRGAVPIILATYPRLSGLEDADLIFNLIFFVVLASVLVQGTSLAKAADWLGVQRAGEQARPYPVESISQPGWQGDLQEIKVPGESWMVNRAVYELGLPERYLIVLIARGDEFLIPNGSIVLRENDRMLGLADQETHAQVAEMVNQPRQG